MHELQDVVAGSHFAVLEAEVGRATHVGVLAVQGAHNSIIYFFFANGDLLRVGKVLRHPFVLVALLGLCRKHGSTHFVENSTVLHCEVLEFVVDLVLGGLSRNVVPPVVGLVAALRFGIQHLLEEVS